VQSVEKKTVPEILNAIKLRTFEPKQTAFVEEDLPAKVDAADSTASVAVTNYGIHNVDLTVNASGNNFLFVSEMHYPPGWNCTIDGAPAPIYKTNYAFRGVMIPKGKHDVKFSFVSRGFQIGKALTIGVNLLLIGAFLFLGFDYFRNRKKAA
jgi:uncharacterized membrane protein YfhO